MKIELLYFEGCPSWETGLKNLEIADLWHEERETYSLSCRVYSTPAGIKGFPTVSMRRQQLKQFKQF